MTTFIFSSKEEFINQAKVDRASQVELKWAKEQTSLEMILKEIPFSYRAWCLIKGYYQFEEGCPWEQLDGCDWRYLLINQPQFSSFCS